MRSVKQARVRGKRIIVRVDFNVLIEKGKVKDDFRIKKSWPTIELLKKKGAKIILISHISEGRGQSLRPVAKYLKLKLLPDKNFAVLRKKISQIKNGEIILLENLRRFKEEEKNDKKFSKNLASLGDIYVNESFSASHRNHASVVGITEFLPSYTGLLFEEEHRNLKIAFKPPHPFLLILGGVKFDTKLGVLEKFEKIADKIFVGGALANNFFWAQNVDVGRSIVDLRVNIKKFLKNPKIVVPVDVNKKNNKILDIGPMAVKQVGELIKKAKFILWNGPVGDFETKGFDKGTLAIARLIAKSRAKSIVGGGDTVAAVRKIGLGKFSFVSTAGGAMLTFLAKGTLPGIEALKNKKEKLIKMILDILNWLISFITEIISSGGYLGVFLFMVLESACLPIPSEIIMPFSGYLVFSGRFSFWLVVLAGAMGNLIGSLAAYFLGFFELRGVLEKYGKYILISKKDLDRADRWFAKHGSEAAFFSRLLPVVRTFISLPAGIVKTNIKKFSFYTFVGSFIWSAFLTYIGMKLGENWQQIQIYFHRFNIFIVLAIILAIIWFVRKHLKN